MNDAKGTAVQSLFGTIGSQYGPYAFGVLSLLLIWFTIVKPELDTRAIDLRSHAELVKAQHEVVSAMNSTAQTMSATAIVLERTVDKLEAVRQ